MTIRRRVAHRQSADRARRARLIHDDDRLMVQVFRRVLGEIATRQIGVAARTERYDERYQLRRVFAMKCAGAGEQGDQGDHADVKMGCGVSRHDGLFAPRYTTPIADPWPLAPALRRGPSRASARDTALQHAISHTRDNVFIGVYRSPYPFKHLPNLPCEFTPKFTRVYAISQSAPPCRPTTPLEHQRASRSSH